MKHTHLRWFFLIFTATILIQNKSYASNNKVFYEDSSVNVVNRTAAVLLLEEGKNLYYEMKYREALLRFKDAYAKDKYNHQCSFWIGKCHYELNNFGYAKQYAHQARALNKEETDDILILKAQAHHQLNELDSAIICYTQLLDKLPKQRIKDLRIDFCIASCNYALEQKAAGKVNKRVEFPEPINTGYSEYAPILTHNGKTLYFTARKENTTGGRSNPDDNQYFEDNYRAVWNENEKKWDSITNQMDRLNGNGFDCISYLSADGMKGLMTVNTTATGAKEVTQSSDIFEITFSDKGKWQTPKLIRNKSINSSFFDGAATMTADGSTLFFVSDRKADKSGTDIYMVQKNGNKWGEAVPVSDSINTPFNETTPYISPDGRFLFFSSKGHVGMGGYDIFVSENLGKTWSKPVNLGAEINTVNDDTHFQYYAKLKKAVSAGLSLYDLKGQIDIFEFDMNLVKLPLKL